MTNLATELFKTLTCEAVRLCKRAVNKFDLHCEELTYQYLALAKS